MIPPYFWGQSVIGFGLGKGDFTRPAAPATQALLSNSR